jgi:hypothetical protein
MWTVFICTDSFFVYTELILLDILSCSSHLIYDDVSIIFWPVCFVGFVVYHQRTEAVSFHNFVIVLNIGDDAKSLCWC